ncbi:MAG: type II toxin-antitoxin system HicA family toxin [Alphaproteobacteria bacterium]|nr:type II toxin-antitoxin system HicA family toxin [Alphaproteobacteria bacterium]
MEHFLKSHGFFIKRQSAAHVQWEGTVNGLRRLVTISKHGDEVKAPDTIKSIFNQSGLDPKKFYKN